MNAALPGRRARAGPAGRAGRRALVELTEEGRTVLAADRREREGWLAEAIEEEFSEEEQATLERAVPLLRRLAES